MAKFKPEYFPDTKEELVAMSDELLLEAIHDGYHVDPIPPCRVCGDKLEIGSCGGGKATVWICSMYEDDPENPGNLRVKEGRTTADEHYSMSQYTQYQSGDRRVLELARRYQMLMKTTNLTFDIPF